MVQFLTYSLGTDLRVAVDRAKENVVRLEDRFPVDIAMLCHSVHNGEGKTFCTKNLTLHRRNPELVEQLYSAINAELQMNLPENTTREVKGLTLQITDRAKPVRVCPICNKGFTHNFARHVTRCGNNKYCLHCSTFVDCLPTHELDCRTTKYSCVICNETFTNSSTHHSHQKKCRAPPQGGSGDQVQT